MVFLTQAQLRENPKNPRKSFGNLAGLADSIKNNGQKIALRVKPTGDKKGDLEIYEIIAGHRRFKAFQSLGKEYKTSLIKCEIATEKYDPKSEKYDPTAELFDHITTNDGEPLTVLEQANVFSQLRDTGLIDADIARAIGKSQTHVADALLLWDKAPAEMKKKIEEGKISASTVIESYKEMGDQTDTVLKAAEKIADGKKVTKKHIDKVADKPVKATTKKASAPAVEAAAQPEPKQTPAPATEKVKPADLTRLKNLFDVVASPPDGMESNENNVVLLGQIIKWLSGDIDAVALTDLFFTPLAETETTKEAAKIEQAPAPEDKVVEEVAAPVDEAAAADEALAAGSATKPRRVIPNLD